MGGLIPPGGIRRRRHRPTTELPAGLSCRGRRATRYTGRPMDSSADIATRLRARQRGGVRPDPRLLRRSAGSTSRTPSRSCGTSTGTCVESFSPDFFLPDLDLYVEMTTLRQKLVRKKNRKLRRLRELYPDLRIKLFYARDFRALMLKYGKLALADELSGTPGQSTPAMRSAALDAGRGSVVGAGIRGPGGRRPGRRGPAGSAARSGAPPRRRSAADSPATAAAGSRRGDPDRARASAIDGDQVDLHADVAEVLADRGPRSRPRSRELGRPDQRRLRRPAADPRSASSRARCRSWPT